MRNLLIVPYLHSEPTSLFSGNRHGWIGWSPPKLFPLYLETCLCAHNHVSFWKNTFFLYKWCYICLQNNFVCFIPSTIGWGNLSLCTRVTTSFSLTTEEFPMVWPRHELSDLVFLVGHLGHHGGSSLKWAPVIWYSCLCNRLALTVSWSIDLLLVNRIKQRRSDITSVIRRDCQLTLASRLFLLLTHREACMARN